MALSTQSFFEVKIYKLENPKNIAISHLNPFVPNAPLLYTLKASESLTVLWCFQGVEKGCIGNKWVNVNLLRNKFISKYLS